MSIKIRPLELHDFPDWLLLWDGNNMGKRDEVITTETWARINDSDSPVNGLGAFDGETMVGFLHYILHPVTGHIGPACYMQDVFVDPEHRRKGIAKKLVQELAKYGQKASRSGPSWARIYWVADNDNEEAQALYKNIGVKLNFALHVMLLD